MDDVSSLPRRPSAPYRLGPGASFVSVKITIGEIARIADRLSYPNYQKLLSIIKGIDPSPKAKKLLNLYCRNHLTRMRNYPYPHHVLKGITAVQLNQWGACDTFHIVIGSKHLYILHYMNLHSKFSAISINNSAPTGKCVVKFLYSLRDRGLLARNILFDLGREFYNIDVDDFLALMNIAAYFCPVAAHWANPCERRHRTIRHVLQKLILIYGAKVIIDLLIQALVAINESPTGSLFGMSPYQYQYLQNPLTIIPPEERSTPELNQLTNPSTAGELLKMKIDARAALEKLKKDDEYIAEMRKLNEECRKYYGEGPDLAVDDMVEYFDNSEDKAKRGWKGPGKLLYIQNNKTSKMFLVDVNGHIKKVHAAHIRRHLSVHEMTFPKQILRIVRKTHGKGAGKDAFDYDLEEVPVEFDSQKGLPRYMNLVPDIETVGQKSMSMNIPLVKDKINELIAKELQQQEDDRKLKVQKQQEDSGAPRKHWKERKAAEKEKSSSQLPTPTSRQDQTGQRSQKAYLLETVIPTLVSLMRLATKSDWKLQEQEVLAQPRRRNLTQDWPTLNRVSRRKDLRKFLESLTAAWMSYIKILIKMVN